jgi:hypothetical protein
MIVNFKQGFGFDYFGMKRKICPERIIVLKVIGSLQILVMYSSTLFCSNLLINNTNLHMNLNVK